MDRRAPNPPTHRDVMFCHQCESEWFRDEHGLECPECHSEFCEVIESNNDPRHTDHAPDPDMDDIDDLDLHSTARGHFHARFERTPSGNVREAQTGQTGMAGFLVNAVSNMFGALTQPQEPERQDEHEEPDPQFSQRMVHRSQSGTTVTQHVRRDGYSFTMTTTRGGNLSPRNANSPQALNQQPEPMDDVIRQMMMNIGVYAPGMHPRGHFHHEHFGPGPLPFPAALFQVLGLPPAGAMGDAVYSQEGLDRIISQLMEQHQTGNAPGPASESAISSLPTRAITKNDLGDSGTAECSICMDSVEEGTTVTVLPCEHWFHGECIKAWLSEHDTCPHCRQGISAARPADSSASIVPGAYPRNSQSSRSRSRSPTVTRRSTNRRRSSSQQIFSSIREAFHGNSRRT